MDRRLTTVAGVAAVLAVALLLPNPGTTEARRPTPTPAPTTPPAPAQVSIYGAWHCSQRLLHLGPRRGPSTEFDARTTGSIDRGDGRPSVNLVVLSFVQPAAAAEPDERRHDARRRPASG